MSEPSLLEDHLLSRCPISGSISKRFGIATKIWVCPTLSGLLPKYFYSNALTCSFAEFSVTALFIECSVALACLFSPQKCCAISAEFSRCERDFNLKASLLYHKAVLKTRGFKPKIFDKQGQTVQYELPGGPKYSVFLISNGTPASFLEKNPQNQGHQPPLAYFFNTAANPDGKEHIRVLSPNEYGFEDIYGGGDQDFDDMIVKIETVLV